jgi:hypothetical protein
MADRNSLIVRSSATLSSKNTTSAQQSPTTAANKEAKGIPVTVIVLGINCNILIQKHPDKIEGSYNSMPESALEVIGMTCKTFIDDLLFCTAGKQYHYYNR